MPRATGAQTNLLTTPAVVPLVGDIFSPCIVQISCLGRSDEGDFVWTVGVWSLSCLHLSHRVHGTKPEVRGHHGGPSRSKVYHSPRGRRAISQTLQCTHDLPSRVFSSPTFSNPSKWLGQGKKKNS